MASYQTKQAINQLKKQLTKQVGYLKYHSGKANEHQEKCQDLEAQITNLQSGQTKEAV